MGATTNILEVLKAGWPVRRRKARFFARARAHSPLRSPLVKLPFLRRPLFAGEGESLGRIGNLEVRLARTPTEVRMAQALRYQVFYREMAAVPSARTRLTRRDEDRFDAFCDHLLVLDHDCPVKTLTGGTRPAVVGTYRLLRQQVAERNGGFYTAAEFDIAPVLAAHKGLNFLELGRSCVLKPYRTKRTVELLWHGIWAYVRRHGIDVMIGCASLEGADAEAHKLALSFLHHNASASGEWAVKALPERFVSMNHMEKDVIDLKAAMNALPPLIKGYLRLGAGIGEGAVVDHQFGTTDVMIILPVSAISARYISHYGSEATRYAA